MKYNIIKYTLIVFVLYQFIIQAGYAYSLPLFNETLNKKGFIKKQPFYINAGYEYSLTDNFNQTNSHISNNKFKVESSKISKESNGIKTEAGLYIAPFIKLFINYTYRDSLLDIKYKLDKSSNIFLTKDYTSSFSKNNDEHIYMAGFETSYEWNIKKYTPYIALKAGFGITVSESYEDIFYNASFTLKAGTYIAFNKNIILNIYTGADYTSLFNNGLMIEYINISIPKEYIMAGISNNINVSLEYEENYNKNINMVLGAECEIYKYSSIFAEIKYINSLIFNTGIKIQF